MMRIDHPVLDDLSPRAFAGLARECWLEVQAGRLLAAAADPLDLGAFTAVVICIRHKVDPPSRPVTFAAPEAGSSGWATYRVPLGARVAGLTRAQAAALDPGSGAGEVIPRAVIGYEAVCRRCGEIFNPDLTWPDGSGLEHYQTAAETPCGGRGDVTGWWG